MEKETNKMIWVKRTKYDIKKFDYLIMKKDDALKVIEETKNNKLFKIEKIHGLTLFNLKLKYFYKINNKTIWENIKWIIGIIIAIAALYISYKGLINL